MTGKRLFSTGRVATISIVAILFIDQAVKIWVRTHMTLHETIDITGWFKLCFVENNGMAYGMEFGSKLLLSIFRLVLISFIGVYLVRQIRNTVRKGYVFCLSMILAGAIGNMIDGMFYGLIFNAASSYYVGYFVPFGTGYAPFLMGKVVDMLYFPLVHTTWPEWLPIVGGQDYIFFSPVFNFADSCISVGVVLLLLFYRKEVGELALSKRMEQKEDKQDNTCETAEH